MQNGTTLRFYSQWDNCCLKWYKHLKKMGTKRTECILLPCRYAYSDEANEDFEKEDTLTLIKPATLATNEAWKTSAHADTKTMQSGNGGPLNDEDLEEDKRE